MSDISDAVEAARQLQLFYFQGRDFRRYNLDYFLHDILKDFKIGFDKFRFQEKFCGMLIVDQHERTIVVNRVHRPSRRLFTFAHELGHFFLHRHKRSEFIDDKKAMDNSQMAILERQANAFASELLVPTETLRLLLDERRRFEVITSRTGASFECVKWRIVNFLRDQAVPHELSVHFADDYKEKSWNGKLEDAYLFNYLDDVDRLKRLPSLKSRKSNKVKQVELVCVCTNSEANYELPVNSNPEVKKLDNGLLYLVSDKNGRFTKCPQCGNTHMRNDGHYCKMCGLYLYNECTRQQPGWIDECGRRNDADARYCEYCGAPTILLEKGILMSWEEMIAAHGEVAVGVSPKDKIDDPFIDDDDDIPF